MDSPTRLDLAFYITRSCASAGLSVSRSPHVHISLCVLAVLCTLNLDCTLAVACVFLSLSVTVGWSAGGVQAAVFRLLFIDIDCCWFTMSNYLRRVTESVQDLPAAAVPDVRVISQQSSSDPDQVVIGFQLSQSTWDRALGAAAVVGFLGGVVYVQRWFKRWQRERRLSAEREEHHRAKAEMNRHRMDLFHAARYSAEEKVTHSGGCHCGRVKFTIEAPSVVRAIDCSSSMGTKKGRHPYVYVTAEDFNLVAGSEFLSVYTFGTHTAKHLFCSVCGVHTMGVPRGNPAEGGISINVHALDHSTVEDLHVAFIPGDHFVADVEPAMQHNRASLSKGIKASKHLHALSDHQGGHHRMADRWLNRAVAADDVDDVESPTRISPHMQIMVDAAANAAKETAGQNRYMRPAPTVRKSERRTSEPTSLIQALVHGTAQAATSVAAAAGTLVDELTMEDIQSDTIDRPQTKRSSLPPSFRNGKVDDVKNQLQRYLKRHLSEEDVHRTPLKHINVNRHY